MSVPHCYLITSRLLILLRVGLWGRDGLLLLSVLLRYYSWDNIFVLAILVHEHRFRMLHFTTSTRACQLSRRSLICPDSTPFSSSAFKYWVRAPWQVRYVPMYTGISNYVQCTYRVRRPGNCHCRGQPLSFWF